MNRRDFNVLGLGALGALDAAWAQPATWPSHPVTFVTPLAAGSPTDALARNIASDLQQRIGQPIVVDNKPGGGSLIGTYAVQRAKPDGYTLLFAVSAHTINPAIRKQAKYDPVKDFTPIGLIGAVAHVLVVGKDVPANNLQELIALGKSQPGKLSYGSAGIGISNHMEGELFARMAGIDLVHVPYSGGSAQAMQDLLAGRVDMMFDVVGTSLPLIKAGKVKPIGLALGKRSRLAPEIPTLQEMGLKGFEAMPWIGLFGPAHMDPAVVTKLSGALQETVADARVQEGLARYGTEPAYLNSAQFTEFLKTDTQKWAGIARDAKIQLDD